MNKTIRLFFEKRDRCKYISHLDLTRCFARAIARTHLPVWYTEGFNPRIYMTFPLPISLGYESCCESLDLRLTDEDYPLEQVAAQLNQTLPEGIRVRSVALPVQKPDAITWADYSIKLEHRDPERLIAAFREFAVRETIMVTKKTKKGEKEIDLRPLFTMIEATAGESTGELVIRLAAGITLNISPGLLMDAFFGDGKKSYYSVERKAILDSRYNNWC